MHLRKGIWGEKHLIQSNSGTSASPREILLGYFCLPESFQIIYTRDHHFSYELDFNFSIHMA